LRLRARPAIMPSTPTPTAIRPTGPRMPKLAGAAMSAAHAGEPRVTKPPRTTSVVVPSRNAHSATEATLLRSWLRTRRTSQIAVTLVSGQILSPSRRKPTECVKSAARARTRRQRLSNVVVDGAPGSQRDSAHSERVGRVVGERAVQRARRLPRRSGGVADARQPANPRRVGAQPC